MSSGKVPVVISFIVSAKDLPTKERTSQGSTFPDPYVKVSIKNGPTVTEWTELGKTDQVNNAVNVSWTNVFTFDWQEKLGQVLHFEVYDYDTLNKDDLIGEVDVDVDNFVLIRNQRLITKLNNGGTLTIRGTTPISMKLSANKLPCLDTVGCGIDAFVECYWSVGLDGEKKLFHKTKVYKNTHEAEWEDSVVFQNYQQGTDQYLTFKVLDDDLLKNDIVGEAVLKVDDLVNIKKVQTHKLSTKPEIKATLTVKLA